MTLSAHLIERMKERLITYEMIQNCLQHGKKNITDNAIKIIDDFICVVIDFNNQILTVTLNKYVNNKVKYIARKYNISKRKATWHYFNSHGLRVS